MPQWEKVPEKVWDETRKIASSTGNYLRLPVYRIKQDGGNRTRTSLKSSVNFKNIQSTEASWQIDDVFDPLTNGNFIRTEMTQTLD